MAWLHLPLAVAAAAIAVLTLLVSGYAVVAQDYRRVLIDRLVLAELALLLLAGLTGLVAFASSGRLSDPLHLAYGIAAVAALPIARYLARAGTARRRGGSMAGGSAVLLGLVARLFMTGG